MMTTNRSTKTLINIIDEAVIIHYYDFYHEYNKNTFTNKTSTWNMIFSPIFLILNID